MSSGGSTVRGWGWYMGSGEEQDCSNTVLQAVLSYSRLLEMELRRSQTIKPKLVMPEKTPKTGKEFLAIV